MILFLLYLFKANNMMLYYFDDSAYNLEEIYFLSIDNNSEVYSNVDMNEYMGGLFEKVYFQGWAYCETDKDNSQKKINLVFKSLKSDLAYITGGNAQFRNDVYGAFKDTKNIYNELNGVEIQFSTLPMKKGEYQLYINVIENNINYGIGDTGLVFIKDSKGFSRKLD